MTTNRRLSRRGRSHQEVLPLDSEAKRSVNHTFRG